MCSGLINQTAALALVLDNSEAIVIFHSTGRMVMKRKFLVLIGILFYLVLPLFSDEKSEIVKIGPSIAFGNVGELSENSMVSEVFPGIEIAIRCTDRIEIWGSYKFNKTETPIGHGLYDVFRLDAFATGLRYMPFRLQESNPFIGIGFNYYHFSDDISAKFVFPIKSALGSYIQGGSYIRVNRLLQAQLFFKYNLVKHTVKRTTALGTYHYRTDFSSLEFGLGILFCIYGK